MVLFPEQGDRIEDYRTQPTMYKEQPALMLAKREDGACVYLGQTEHGEGCTIHERAPYVCRRFDCRRLVLGFGDPGLMQEIAESFDHAVVRAGFRLLLREGYVAHAPRF